MNNKRKKFSALILALLITSSTFSISFAEGVLTTTATAASAVVEETVNPIIWEKSDQFTITRGVTRENRVIFTTNGWQNINILRANLADEFVSIDTLASEGSKGKLTTVNNLANSIGAVAAINASFFAFGENATGNPLGTIIKSGSLLSATSDFNKYGDSMASFSLTDLNQAIYEYWKTDISITAANGYILKADRYNKANGSSYTDFTIFDNKWGATSPGTTEIYPDMVEMLVVNGIVAQINISQPAIALPDNSYVVVTRAEGSKTLLSNFKIGDRVSLSVSTTPDWNNVKMSLSGSAILVKDGQIPATFSYTPSDVAKISPKTAVGTSTDGKTLIAVTVDGRQNSGIGMTLSELAEYMKSLGAHNAINLDGGGSTTMVTRELGNQNTNVVNNPSDGRSRGVSTALGIISTAPASQLAGLVIESGEPNMFVNASRALSVKGYDKYSNPVTVDPAKVKWSIAGVTGTVKSNTLYPTSFGECTITATVGTVRSSSKISVLSSPVRLELSQTTLKLPVGAAKQITVRGYNKNGYSASMNPADLVWKVSSPVGTVSSGTFKAAARGTGYIKISAGETHAYCALSVTSDVVATLDSFEATNGTFLAYPDITSGEYSITSEKVFEGKSAGKLTYNFPESEAIRAAYLVFPGDGIPLTAGTTKISLQVYNDHESSNWLRAEIIDAKGLKQLVNLQENVDWTGWQQAEASLENISMPARLSRIYLVQINPVADSGSIYLDQLQSTNSAYPVIDTAAIPRSTAQTDPQNKVVTFTKATSDSFRFAVFAENKAPANEAEQLIADKYADKINKYVDLAVIVGKGTHQALTDLITKKPFITTITEDLATTEIDETKYSFTDMKNSRFFKLDVSKGGMRVSDKAQWQKFKADLASFKGTHAFVVLQNSPEKFSDSLEMKLLQETLTNFRKSSGKDIWVFYSGTTNESFLYRGVKYFSTAGYAVDGLTKETTDPAKYILVTIKGSTVTYAYKPVI